MSIYGGGSSSGGLGSIGGAVAGAVARSAGSSSSGRKRSSGSSSSSSSRRSSGSSSGSSSRSSGGSSSGGGGSVAHVAAPKVTIPSLAQFLAGDSTYQNTVNGSKRSLTDFISDINRRKSEADTQYNQTTASMGRDRDQQLSDLKNEFASRGLINSGLYGQEQGKFQQQYTDQANSLSAQQTGLLADLMTQQKNYQREQDLAIQAAKQEALNRRAAQYNIGA